MKKLIHGRSNKLIFNIEIELDYDVEPIAAAVIPASKDKIDDQTLADYLAFIDEAILEIEDHDLIILETSSSKSSQTSKYFTIADLEQNVVGSMKFVIFLRISNHLPATDEEALQWIRSRRDSTANNLGVKWKVRNIIVNEERFDNYDAAIAYIGECAAKYSETLRR